MGLAVRGMTTVAGIPLRPAAHDRAAAWFPDEWVATPRAASVPASERTAFRAPRALKDPVFWKFSHLKKRLARESSSRRALVRTGVLRILSRIRSCAPRTCSRVTSPMGRGASLGHLVALREGDAGCA